MTPRQKLQRAYKGTVEALALLYRDHTEDERREAARALGIEHMLPDGEQGEMELNKENEK